MHIKQRSNVVAAFGVIVVGFMLICFAGVSEAAEQPQGEKSPPPLPEVSVVTVQPSIVTLTSDLPGRTSPYLVAEVRPQVNGIVEKRLFTEGSNVKEGDVLYEIDPAPYQAAYDTAIAGLARAEANVPPLELRAQRQKDLVPKGAVSQQDYDEVTATLKQARAEIEYSKAMVKSARINLQYTHIKAPISGRIGKSNVTVGALATAYQGPPFATIQQLDPIYVDVPQSTAQLQNLQRRLKDGQLKHDEASVSKVQLILEDGTAYPAAGTLQFRDVTVEPTTGSVTLRILFPNPEVILLPGLFVRATVTEGTNEQAILVPQQAVSRTPKGAPLVLVVNAEDKVEQRMLTLERTYKDQWLVSAGLTPGERVIFEGLQKVRPGASVKVVPSEGDKTQPSAPEKTSTPATKTN